MKGKNETFQIESPVHKLGLAVVKWQMLTREPTTQSRLSCRVHVPVLFTKQSRPPIAVRVTRIAGKNYFLKLESLIIQTPAL